MPTFLVADRAGSVMRTISPRVVMWWPVPPTMNRLYVVESTPSAHRRDGRWIARWCDPARLNWWRGPLRAGLGIDARTAGGACSRGMRGWRRVIRDLKKNRGTRVWWSRASSSRPWFTRWRWQSTMRWMQCGQDRAGNRAGRSPSHLPRRIHQGAGRSAMQAGQVQVLGDAGWQPRLQLRPRMCRFCRGAQEGRAWRCMWARRRMRRRG
jgi:hypothetical protein